MAIAEAALNVSLGRGWDETLTLQRPSRVERETVSWDQSDSCIQLFNVFFHVLGQIRRLVLGKNA